MAASTDEILHARVVDGPDGLGRCLRATRSLRVGEIVMLERPLLFGEPPDELPPISAFASIPEAASPMPSDVPELGGKAWPRQSTFDAKVFGLLLSFAEADNATRAVFLAELQHEMERPFDRVGPAEECARLAEEALRARGAPWLAEEWELPEGVEARGLLAKLLRIISVSAMPYRGGGALYRVASKLAHACHGANTHYEADAARGLGVFTALRPIREGELLTHPYLTMTLSLVSTPLRRRILYCQRSMLCCCPSCEGDDDQLRRLPPGAELGGATPPLLSREEELAASVLELYASVEVERPRALPAAQQRRLAELQRGCEAELGERHWATQAGRRLVLMQSYEAVFKGGSSGGELSRGMGREQWEAGMRACEAFVEEVLASLVASADATSGGGSEALAVPPSC